MCLFCRIISGEVPCYKIYEDQDVLAFLDISQATPGHTLVIPKKHATNIFDLDDESCQKTLLVVKNIANLLKERLNVSAVNILNNSGSLAGQSVNHFHIHIIPRYLNDGIELVPPVKESNPNLLKEVYSKLTK